MSQIEPTERRSPEPGAPEERLAAAAKQLRIVRETMEEESGAGAAHVEVAIREIEAARHQVE